MANSLAIATVTATLRNLLMQVTIELPDAMVTAKPPHKARSASDRGNQLNLFLYQTAPNTAWRDRDTTHLAFNGGGSPPLALNLYYLLTAYGRDDEDLLSHRLLGQAMAILHQHAQLTATELRVALPENDLHQQIEQVRVMPQALETEDLAKIWGLFQVPYSLSVAYQVSVVLIAGLASRHTSSAVAGTDASPPSPPEAVP